MTLVDVAQPCYNGKRLYYLNCRRKGMDDQNSRSGSPDKPSTGTRSRAQPQGTN